MTICNFTTPGMRCCFDHPYSQQSENLGYKLCLLLLLLIMALTDIMLLRAVAPRTTAATTALVLCFELAFRTDQHVDFLS